MTTKVAATITKIKMTTKAPATGAMTEKGVVVTIEEIGIMIEVVVAEMIEDVEAAVVMIEVVVADLPIVKLLID